MTPSEKLVYDLCTNTAISLWSYLSPQQPNGKELCDALVVFGDDVVIFSVKDIALSDHEDPSVVASRWTRKAIDASVKQLGGAKRILSSMNGVVRQDGSDGVRLPPLANRRVHLVAVASGANRTLPFVIGADQDIGYVHVLDETALTTILTELDTTSDYLHYLRAKESFQGSIVCEGEEDLLGLYIHSGRTFPQQDHVFVDGGIWSAMLARPEFIARKSGDAVSYWWDHLITTLIDDSEADGIPISAKRERELVFRQMASESRFDRRVLSELFLGWLMSRTAGARSFVSSSGVAYVFATYPRDYTRTERVADLGARCFVARSPSLLGCETVIGIATELYEPEGYSLDVVYQCLPQWTDDDELKAQEGRELFGIYQDPVRTRASFDEFPPLKGASLAKTEKNRNRRRRQGRK